MIDVVLLANQPMHHLMPVSDLLQLLLRLKQTPLMENIFQHSTHNPSPSSSLGGVVLSYFFFLGDTSHLVSVYHYQSFCHNLPLFTNKYICILYVEHSYLLYLHWSSYVCVALWSICICWVCIISSLVSGCCVALLDWKMSSFLMDCMCECLIM